MSISAEKKQELIASYKTHKFDTGSSYVQIAILTQRIANITSHLQQFKKDLHCKYGLVKLVSRRKKLLSYIKSSGETGQDKYYDLVKKLGIRK